MLLVCIRSYLKSVLRYTFLILDTYHPDTLYLREQGCEDPWLLFEVREQISLGNTGIDELLLAGAGVTTRCTRTTMRFLSVSKTFTVTEAMYLYAFPGESMFLKEV